jgi:Phage integrase, N-terminal SAM-like domain/Arm DNA-binding domain
VRGSVRKRGETWTWYLWVPDAISGKPRQRSKGGFRTKKECQDALNDSLADLRKGTFVEPSRRTIASFLTDEWLPAVAAQGRRPGTVANYRIHVTAHIIPALGGIELQQLSPAHLNNFYRALLSEGRRNGRPMAQKTVRNVHNVLHRALQDAMRWGLVVRNVSSAANPPAGKSPERAVWTPTELRTFINHVRSDRLFAVWMLFATTGMRRSEVAGLRTVDLDLAAARVSPRMPRVLVDHQVVVSEPKPAPADGPWPSTRQRSPRSVTTWSSRKPSGRLSAPAT